MKYIFSILSFLLIQINFSQSVRSIEINTYKYIVVDEIIGKHSGEMRRFFVKNLKKGGYNIVNLKKPLMTHSQLPQDLKDDPSLALYLVAEENNAFCVDIITNLYEIILSPLYCNHLVKPVKRGFGI